MSTRLPIGHHRVVRVLLCALLFAAACKTDKPTVDNNTKTATPVEKDHPPTRTTPPPSLPQPDRPRIDIPEPRDWSDPAVREEMEARRAEREARMKEMLDTNKDGVVSPEEQAQRAKPLFDRLDANADGKLTPDEIASSDRRMGFDDPAAIDTDKNGEISLGELNAANMERRQRMRERWRGGRARQTGSAED